MNVGPQQQPLPEVPNPLVSHPLSELPSCAKAAGAARSSARHINNANPFMQTT
jgi:hypothetical protein